MSDILISNFIFPILILLFSHLLSFFHTNHTRVNIYRTFMSLRSKETMELSQKLAIKGFLITGLLDLMICIFCCIFQFEIPLFFFDLLTIIITMLIIEGILYHQFDFHGKRKN